MKTWVIAKEDLDVGKYKGLVPKGEVGYIKRNPHMKDEKGYIQFPQTVCDFPEDKLEPAKLPTREEALNIIYRSYLGINEEGWFFFEFRINKDKVIEAFFENLPKASYYTRKYKAMIKDLVNQMFDPNFDDASYKNDFKWISKWKYSEEGRIFVQHKNKKTYSELSELTDNQIIDLAMDIQLISKKILKAAKETEEWLQTKEVSEIYG